jgi:hypothetical protein
LKTYLLLLHLLLRLGGYGASLKIKDLSEDEDEVEERLKTLQGICQIVDHNR